MDDLVFLGRAGVRISSCHSRAFPDGPSLSAPGRAVVLMSRRLTWGMAERMLAIFGEGVCIIQYVHLPAGRRAACGDIAYLRWPLVSPPTIRPSLLDVVERS